VQAVADVAAAVAPLLLPARNRMRCCLERWADEESASAPGERRAVARALARAALAVAGQNASAAAFAMTDVPAGVDTLLQSAFEDEPPARPPACRPRACGDRPRHRS
jgi:hypothetical protein